MKSLRAMVVGGRPFLDFAIELSIVGGTIVLLAKLPPIQAMKGSDDQTLALAILALPALLAYALAIRLVERRSATELAPRFLPRDLAHGSIVSAALIGLTAGIAAMAGDFAITGVNGWTHDVTVTACNAIWAGVAEEIVFRGLLLRCLERIGGSWGALAVTSTLFGVAHLGNPNSSLAAVLGITLGLGLLTGAAYLATHRLWLPIAIHAGWNFTMAGVLGVPNSGTLEGSILASQRDGSLWLTGGAFGFEGSLQATVMTLAVALWFIRAARRRHRLRDRAPQPRRDRGPDHPQSPLSP